MCTPLLMLVLQLTSWTLAAVMVHVTKQQLCLGDFWIKIVMKKFLCRLFDTKLSSHVCVSFSDHTHHHWLYTLEVVMCFHSSHRSFSLHPFSMFPLTESKWRGAVDAHDATCVFRSSDPCEAVGHRPAVLPDHHDENRTHQTRRVHGLPEEVRNCHQCRRV